EHAPDLLLISQYDPELGEVAAFEELIGSHGGLRGPQTQPFILHPTDWELNEAVPLGAPAVYRNIRRWLGTIGIELGKDQPGTSAEPAPAPAEAVGGRGCAARLGAVAGGCRPRRLSRRPAGRRLAWLPPASRRSSHVRSPSGIAVGSAR